MVMFLCRRWIAWAAAPVFLLSGALAAAQPFRLPTANTALFDPDGQDKFFVGTIGRDWTSGCFGCVRSDGWQIHEGLDIRCLQRDSRGEPTDPVLAAADGTVVYFNSKSALSNYGKYVVLAHRVEGIEVYTLYAHLSEIRSGLRIGQSVRAGESIAIMGRTANTAQGISRERAHVHFEIDLVVNERFPAWHKTAFPGQRNDHGMWNGQNMLGLDPRLVLLEGRRQGAEFSLLQFIRTQTELCRVMVRDADFSWARRYAPLVRRNPAAESEGTAGYEIAMNYNGVMFELIPRTASEMKSKSRYHLLSVNEAEYQRNPCRRLVAQKGGKWELTTRGINLLDLLTY